MTGPSTNDATHILNFFNRYVFYSTTFGLFSSSQKYCFALAVTIVGVGGCSRIS